MQEIYFRLVRENGAEILADRVNKPNLKTVADLRDELKENKCKNALTKFDAGQLKVYLTEDDAKNATSRLGISHPLAGLGKDEDDALLVLVPTAVTEKPEVPDSSKCHSSLSVDSADRYMNVPCSSVSDH